MSRIGGGVLVGDVAVDVIDGGVATTIVNTYIYGALNLNFCPSVFYRFSEKVRSNDGEKRS